MVLKRGGKKEERTGKDSKQVRGAKGPLLLDELRSFSE